MIIVFIDLPSDMTFVTVQCPLRSADFVIVPVQAPVQYGRGGIMIELLRGPGGNLNEGLDQYLGIFADPFWWTLER